MAIYLFLIICATTGFNLDKVKLKLSYRDNIFFDVTSVRKKVTEA